MRLVKGRTGIERPDTVFLMNSIKESLHMSYM